MLTLCPQCRAPSNVQQKSCWVCKRVFDGSEPRIGDVPYAREPAAFQRRASPDWLVAESDNRDTDWWDDVSESRVSVGRGR